MTTVADLIKELEKMPKEQYVLLNNNTKNSDVSVFFSDIKVETGEIPFPGGPAEKQQFILLNQGGII